MIYLFENSKSQINYMTRRFGAAYCRYFRCGFIRFMFGAVQVLSVLILTFHSLKVTEFPPVWERAAYSVYNLLFCCLFICPFDVLDELWVLIRPVPEESLLEFTYLERK